MNIYLIIGGMALITFAIRYAMFVASGHLVFPAWIENALRFVPPAVLSALIFPAVLIPSGDKIELSVTSPHLVGAIAAFVVGRVSNNLLATIATGMATFWAWRFVVAMIFP